ncbi:unnamed protein product [Acanthoscelides obtectus]|uniref:Uncharacterized protein n=1 Tax=Acanthoscelides obtectus TaxID=200917 RepID=A0A9P0Q087_ACAOB|nr:unnamed protein product [Acanthoscelides obtectus]
MKVHYEFVCTGNVKMAFHFHQAQLTSMDGWRCPTFN